MRIENNSLIRNIVRRRRRNSTSKQTNSAALLKSLGREILVALLTACFFLQPNLMVLAAGKNLDSTASRNAENFKRENGDTQQKDSTANEPLVTKSAVGKKANFYRATKGLSKAEAIAMKAETENQRQQIEAAKQTRLIEEAQILAAQIAAKTSPNTSAEQNSQPGAEEDASWTSYFSSLFNWFSSTSNETPEATTEPTAVSPFAPATVTTTTAIVRHGFNIDGRVEGSIQQLLGESTIFNSGSVVTQDLLVPGVPTVNRNGNPTFGGIVTGSGSSQPTNYQITLNSNSQLRNLITRTDPATMPTVNTPPAATGTQSVTANNQSQIPVNYTNVRDLTLNSNAGTATVTAGSYRNFSIGSGNTLKLGVAGATQAAIYNFQGLTLNSGSSVQIAGPVVINLASGVNLNSAVGASGTESWLKINLSSGGLTLNSGSSLFGSVVAPNGTVTINAGTVLTGSVVCDRLTVNSNGVLRLLPSESVPSASIAVTSPANNTSTSASSISVAGTAQSGIGISSVTVNNQAATYNASTGNWTISNVALTLGSNIITARAVDMQGGAATAQVTVTRTQPAPDTTAPNLAITTPANNLTTQSESIIVSGTVSDPGANASGVAQVTVNGAAAVRDVAAGTWTKTNVGLNVGSNTITVRAADNAGNERTATVNVTREPVTPPDTIAPLVSIITPENNAVVYTPTVTVTGTAKDEGANATGVRVVRVNGHPAIYNSGNQTWTIDNVSLEIGNNTIIAEVEDNASPTPNVGRAQIQINRQNVQPPTVTVTGPANGAMVASNVITVVGQVNSNTPNVPVTVTVNGQEANVVGSEFTKVVSLTPGANVITVVAANSLNQISQASINVISDTQNPTVALQNVPPTVRPLQSYLIQAQANDNQTVASVEFTVNGQSAAIVQNAPYEFTLQIPGNAVPGNVYNISAIAKDAAGNVAADSMQTIIAGPSGVSGYVFDDATGYSIGGATAALIDPATGTVTDENGEYNLVSGSSFGTVRISKNDFTPVERTFTTASGTGLNLFDARLSAVDAQENTIGSAGGTARGDSGRIQINLAAGVFQNARDIRVTSVSQQGLVNLLPYGWSPIPGAAFDMRPLSATAAQTVNLTVPAQLNIAQVANLSSTSSLVLVRYDEIRHHWRVTETNVIPGANGALTASLPSLGQYAFVIADSGETVPPPAVVGRELPGSVEASDAALNNAQVTATANPKSAIVSPTAKSTINVVANSTTKLPSGVSIETAFDENYRLLGEQNPLIVDRLAQDFVLYSYPSATSAQPKLLGASFVAKPTRTDLTTAQLQFGNVHIAIHAGRGEVSGVLIGTGGGEVSSEDGATLRVEANSLGQNTPVYLTSIDTNLAGISLPEGFEIIGAVDLNTSGATLNQSGVLSIPVRSGDNSRVVVAKVITAGSVRGLKTVARAVEANNRIVSSVGGAPVPAGVNLPGIRTSGRYVFVRVPSAFGYAAGTVKNAADVLTANVRVSSDRMPFIDLTAADGKFVVLTRAESGANAVNNLDAISLNSDATGNAAVSATAQNAVTVPEIRLASAALAISSVTPNNNAGSVLVSSPITVTFNKPISPSTLTGSNFKVTTAADNPVVGAITLLAGNRTASFTPNANLAFATAYQVKITRGVKDVYGNALANEFSSTFTTAQIITVDNRLKPEKIRIAYPNDQGISTITLPAGSVPEGSIITGINNNSGATVSTVAGGGEIVLQITAQVGDEILLIIRQPDGTVYQVAQAAYRRADGVITIGANGGTITSDDGQILLAVPRGAIEGQVNLKMTAAAENEITAPRTGDMSPSEMRFAAGTKIEVSGNYTQKEELHLELPAPAGLAEGQRAVFMQPTKITENNVEREVWQVVTSGKVENGKIKSTSPPFLGVTLPAVIIGLTIALTVIAFVPIQSRAVVGKITQAHNNGVPTPVANATIFMPPSVPGQSANVFTRSNARGDYGLSYTLQGSAPKVTVVAPGTNPQQIEVDTIPYQATDPAWLNGLSNFQTRYAAVEFPDPAGDPQNNPAIIQIEGSTVGATAGQDPLKITGKVLTGSTVELAITTTPAVPVISGNVSVNGSNQPLQITRNANGDGYKALVGTPTEGAYNVLIETFTRQGVPISRATAGFNFVALANPNNCPVLDGNPSVLNSSTPRDGAKNVDVGTRVRLNFSEPVKNLVAGQTVKLFEIGENGAQTPVSGVLTSASLPVSAASEVCSADFQPSASLRGGREYSVKITAGVKDKDNNPLSAEFTSRFTTFRSLILNNPNDIPTGAFKVAAAGDYMATLELSGSYPPSTKLSVYNIGEPQTPTLVKQFYTPQLSVALDVKEYEDGQEISYYDDATRREVKYKNIIALTTTSHPYQDRANNVFIYSINEDEQNPLKLIGVVSLNYPNQSPDFPASIKILGKRAYIGSTSSGGYWVVDIEGAIARLREDGENAWFPAINPVGASQSSGYASDRVRQKLPNILQNVLWRTYGISAVNQAVNNGVVPVVYPAPLMSGQNSGKATAINANPTQFDNRLGFFDADSNGTDDRVMSQVPYNPQGFAIDVKAGSQIPLIGGRRDLAVYLAPDRFWLFDVNNPSAPAQKSSVSFADYQLPTDALALELEDKYVYVLFSDRVAVFDISNPNAPQISAVISDLGGGLRRFAVRNGFVYTLGNTGLRVSTGRAFASVIVRGIDNGTNDFCATPVLISKATNKMLQTAEVSFLVYGHDLPQTATVKIRRERIVGENTQSELLATLQANIYSDPNTPSVLKGSALWTTTEPIDIDASYTATVVLDEGQGGELIAKPELVPFSYLINQFPSGFALRYDKDINRQPLGPNPGNIGGFNFLLGRKAKVTLKINNQIIKPADEAGNLRDAAYEFAFGKSTFYISRLSFPDYGVFPAGKYQFEMTATYTGSSETQVETGIAELGDLPAGLRAPGQTVVNNVSIPSGNLGLNYTDLNIPNRGLSLNLTRSYNSLGGNLFSPLGYNWRHSYQVTLAFDAGSKIYMLINGEGGNQTFNETYITGRTIKSDGPYQGTLEKNTDGSFDYYTKSRTKYHFRSAVVGTPQEVAVTGYMGNLDYIEEPNKNRIALKYDALGRLERVFDSSNRSLEFVYEQTNAATITGLTGESGAVSCEKKNVWQLLRRNFIRATAAKAWRIIEVRGPGGARIDYNYDDHGNLARVNRSVLDDTISGVAGSDGEWKYEYDETNGADSNAEHLLKAVQSPNRTSADSYKTRYAYDLSNLSYKVKQINFPEGITNKFRYERPDGDGGNKDKVFVADGRANDTAYTFQSRTENDVQLPETIIDAPLGAHTYIAWNKYGEKEKEIDPEGLETHYQYDFLHNPELVTVMRPNGDVFYKTETDYDQTYSKPKTVTVYRGDRTLTTNYTIDPNNGNVRLVTLPNGRTVRMDYNAQGDLFSSTDQFGNQTNITSFDPYGNPQTVETIDAGGRNIQTSEKRYDLRSRLISSSGTLEPSVIYTYDALDRLANQKVSDPAGFRDPLEVVTTYKNEGQIASVERKGANGLRYKATNTYDELNRLKNVTEIVSGTSGYTQNYTYDNNSNLETQIDRRGVTTTRNYNELNFVTKETVKNATEVEKAVMTAIEIDRIGNVKKYTDLYGKEIQQIYDGAHRLQEKVYSDCGDGGAACSETIDYDGRDNVVRRTDKNGKPTVYTYDALNRPQTATNPLGQRITYTYIDNEHKTEIFDETRGLTETTRQDAVNRPLEQTVKFGAYEYKTVYAYNGLTTTMTDPRQTITTMQSSAFGETGESLTAGNGADGQEYMVSMRYSAFGAVKQMTDALDRQTTYAIDGLNRVRAASYPKPAHLAEVSETWDYDGGDLLVAHKDKRGTETQTIYDALGRKKTVAVNNTGSVTILSINYADSLAKETRTDANNHQTTFLYDGLHRVKQLTNADGKAKSFVYDGENLRAESDYKTKLTQYGYDGLNRLRQELDREGNLTRIDYADAPLSTKTVTDRRGSKTIETYDALSRLTEISSGGLLTARYEYDANGNRTAATDGEANRSEFVFNNLNRMTAAKRGGAAGGAFIQTESYGYDAAGNLKTYADGRGGTVAQAFDELDHLKERRDGENNLTTFKHDGEGLLLETVEPCGNGGTNCDTGTYKTAYAYNAFGSPVNVSDANQKGWTFNYYPDGKLLKDVNDPLARKTDYVYDALDRLKSIKQPLVPATVYGYDENSNVVSITDPNNQTQTITPDLLDRVDTQSYKNAGGTEVLKYKYSYDKEDNARQIDETLTIGGAASNYVHKRDYDTRNRLKTAVDKFGHQVEFGYDAADNIRSITDRKSDGSPTATTTSYVYDKQNRLQTVTLPNSETVSYNWFADGLLERVSYASGMKREFGYDNADRVMSIRNTINASEIQEFGYGYDANTNRRSETKKINGGVSRTFAYKFDGLNRLAEARETTPAPNTQPQPSQTITVNETTDIKGYEYDAVGNREKEKSNASTVPITRTANAQGVATETRGAAAVTPLQTATASFDQLNRLIGLTEADGTQNVLSYDNNGNLLQTRRNVQVQQSFEYDPRNQLRRVTDGANAEVARFDYDADRRRVEKSVYGYVPERYVYAGDKIISEYRGNSGYETNLAKYQIGADETIRGEFFNQNEGARYYFSDALGSTTALAGNVSNSWTATNSYAYDGWGKVTGAIGSSNNSIGYTGQRLDAETGLMALGNGERYYSPALARFVQQDSFTGSLNQPPSLNRFSYVHNNPLTYRDPTGHYIESAWDLFSLGVGVYSFQDNIRKGNYGSAALDAVGIVADAAALALPIIPGGVGVAIRASRAVAYTVKTVQTVDRAVNIYQAGNNAVEEFGKGNYGMAALNTGFALLGAKGFSDSAKGLSKLEDLNAGKGVAKYFKEYDSLSKDLEKLKGFTQGIADHSRAFAKGWKESGSGTYLGSYGGGLQKFYDKLEGGVKNAFKQKETTALAVYDRKFALSQMDDVEIRFPARGLNETQRRAFSRELFIQEAELNRLSLTDTANLESNLAKFHSQIAEEANFYRAANNNARRMARERLRGSGTGDAAHNLDAVAGGFLHNITELRDSIQQRVGSLWKNRWQQIEPGRKHRLISEFED